MSCFSSFRALRNTVICKMSVNIPATPDLDNVTQEQIKQFTQLIKTYNKLTQSCFTDCVSDFTSRKVAGSEDRCAINCIEKILKVNQRISDRFQEFQMLANENALAAAQKLGQIPPNTPS